MQLRKAWEERCEKVPTWSHRTLGSTGQAAIPNVEPALNGRVATLQQPQPEVQAQSLTDPGDPGSLQRPSDSLRHAIFCCFVRTDTGTLPNAPQMLHSAGCGEEWEGG